MEKVHISVYLWSVIMYMSVFMGAVCIFYYILGPNVCVWGSTADDGLEVRILDAKSFFLTDSTESGENHLLILEILYIVVHAWFKHNKLNILR